MTLHYDSLVTSNHRGGNDHGSQQLIWPWSRIYKRSRGEASISVMTSKPDFIQMYFIQSPDSRYICNDIETLHSTALALAPGSSLTTDGCIYNCGRIDIMTILILARHTMISRYFYCSKSEATWSGMWSVIRRWLADWLIGRSSTHGLDKNAFPPRDCSGP